MKRPKKNQVQLVASGDLRLSASQVCWPAQAAMERALKQAPTIGLAQAVKNARGPLVG